MSAPLPRSRFSANIAMLFTEVPFIDRFRAAAVAGFRSVEISTPELFEHSATSVRKALDDHELSCVLFNMPAGDWKGGERGIAALPDREAELTRAVDISLAYAKALKCPRVHCVAGIATPDARSSAIYYRSLSQAVGALAPEGVDVLIEPINQRSIPGFFLRSYAQAAEAIDAVEELTGGKRPMLMFDCFHAQIIGGDLTTLLRQHRHRIGHIQIAGVPGRNEPDEQNEVNYPYVFKVLHDELKWQGHVGCEYIPRAGTAHGLSWLERAGLDRAVAAEKAP